MKKNHNLLDAFLVILFISLLSAAFASANGQSIQRYDVRDEWHEDHNALSNPGHIDFGPTGDELHVGDTVCVFSHDVPRDTNGFVPLYCFNTNYFIGQAMYLGAKMDFIRIDKARMVGYRVYHHYFILLRLFGKEPDIFEDSFVTVRPIEASDCIPRQKVLTAVINRKANLISGGTEYSFWDN